MQVRMDARRAQVSSIPDWATPMPRCVAAVKKTLKTLQDTYLAANVGTVLRQACDSPNVHKDIGGNKVSCQSMMKELVVAFNGDKNYYPFCRSLTLSSYKMAQQMEELFNKNATVRKMKEECSEHCPYVSKMIESMSMMGAFFLNPPEDFGTEPKQIEEMLLVIMRKMNQMCDWYSQVQCTPENMHESCHEFMEAGGMAKEDLHMIAEQCEVQAPCSQACHGMEANLVDFTSSQLSMMMQYPVPSKKAGDMTCSAKTELLKCTEHKVCKKFLSSRMMKKEDELAPYLSSWDDTCKWYEDKCVAQREEKCADEIKVLREDWKEDGCLFMFEEECCGAVTKLATCDAESKCANHLEKGIPLLGVGLEVNIAEQCPKATELMHKQH